LTILLRGICKHWHLGRKRLVMTIIKEGGYGQRRKFGVLNDDFLSRTPPPFPAMAEIGFRNTIKLIEPCGKSACRVAVN
jgi:hypothetical protein